MKISLFQEEFSGRYVLCFAYPQGQFSNITFDQNSELGKQWIDDVKIFISIFILLQNINTDVA